MGIVKLAKIVNEFVKKEDILISEFAGGKVAVDINNIIYGNFKKYYLGELKNINILENDQIDRNKIINKIKKDIVNLCESWLRQYVTPVLIYDGKSNQQLKKIKSIATVKKNYKIKEEINQTISRKKLLEKNTSSEDLEKGVKFDSDEIKKKLSNISYPYYDEIESIKHYTTGLGIPTLVADGEGEKLCASLCIEGKVDAVFTTDTDIFMYQCPVVLFCSVKSAIVGNQLVRSYTKVCMNNILNSFSFTEKQLVDFGIIMGCDHNKPLYENKHLKTNTGRDEVIFKCYDLIREFGTIENFPKNLLKRIDNRKVNYIKCRKLFQMSPWSLLVHKEYGMNDYLNDRRENNIGIFSLWKNKWSKR